MAIDPFRKTAGTDPFMPNETIGYLLGENALLSMKLAQPSDRAFVLEQALYRLMKLTTIQMDCALAGFAEALGEVLEPGLGLKPYEGEGEGEDGDQGDYSDLPL